MSPSTVSRALNKPGRLNGATEQRIREVAEAVGYRLNPMARALPTGRTQMIALILSDITNPVFFELVRGAERVAASRGYILILAESQESADLEHRTAQRLLGSVDGLVLVSARLENTAIRTLSEQKPLLVVNRRLRGTPSLVPDVGPGIEDALDHLQELGHSSLAYLAGPAKSWMSRLREQTLKNAADERGMGVRTIGPNDPTLAGGAAALPALSGTTASAVLAYNDLMAIGLLQACQGAGITVPDDLSIIGFDDIFGSDFTSPPITTIRTPLGRLGEEAARRLIASLDDDDTGSAVDLTTEFVIRNSTARVKV
ncbi:LacI family transcriptional regulator [Allonocardiopsis opalescens]|uniref:LacI family transcriptional regulator n=1 Tax=Allonocardiopsis opalescens TaxID=1144618 RepID=A0A2T0PYS8_9ACTN|nr:LacI family transcriptional regulator [Allonocardiopsis opalescens]